MNKTDDLARTIITETVIGIGHRDRSSYDQGTLGGTRLSTQNERGGNT